MPSTLIGNPLASGAQQVLSGNIWSGTGVSPQGGVHFQWDINASGSVYLALSGGATLNSGSYFLSGGGLLDGVQLPPGRSYFMPKLAFKTSGEFNVFARHDPAASGNRLFYEVL